MKKLGKWILIGFLALMAFVYMTNVYDVPWSRKLPAPTPETVTVAPARDPAPGEFTNYYTKRRAEIGLSLLQQAMPDFSVEMRYDNVNGWLFYDITCPEISADFIRSAQADYGHCVEDWETIVRSTEDIQSSLQRMFTEQNDETVVVVDILNPENPDEVWLSVANGIAGYDVVNGVDLLNGQS